MDFIWVLFIQEINARESPDQSTKQTKNLRKIQNWIWFYQRAKDPPLLSPKKYKQSKKISIIPSNILIWEEKKHCVFFLKITPKTETIKKKFLDFICLIINIKNKANGMLENYRKHICWCGKRFENLFAFIALCCAREQGRS